MPRVRKPKPLPPPLERDVLKACADLIEVYGLDIDRQNTGAMRVEGKGGKSRYVPFGKKGDPDFDGTLPDGRTIHLEIKRPGQRPTAAQYARLRKTNLLGGVGVWVDSAATLAHVLLRVTNGWYVEIDEAGDCWLDEKERT